MEKCGVCRGSGEELHYRGSAPPCERCNGTGYIYPEKESEGLRRKLAIAVKALEEIDVVLNDPVVNCPIELTNKIVKLALEEIRK